MFTPSAAPAVSVTLSEDKEVHWFVMRSLTNLLQMEDRLQREGLECFLPKTTRLRAGQRSRRIEVVPVVPPYIFVHANYDSIRAFKQKVDRLSFIPVLGTSTHSTMKVSDKEMEDFIRVVSQREEKTHIYSAGEIPLAPGQRIRICGGPLAGVEGKLVKLKGTRDKRLMVSVGGILLATTPIDRTFVQLL